jgi:hypothetical protein
MKPHRIAQPSRQSACVSLLAFHGKPACTTLCNLLEVGAKIFMRMMMQNDDP